MEKESQALIDAIDAAEELHFVGLSPASLFLAFCIFISIVIFFSIKIFLVNHIYYSSREITKLQERYNLLYEENKFLKKELESLRFQYRIINLED
ncbi:hypothetical protein LW135_01740 [Helicobacter sp. faydin-H20]|uniref:hypothetical protein n=1 Tax=Helicobacter anatolicus TaxID=2905874 RepID=UPI001E4972B9|nr:hypothetical protein [Helicobacter anatolicus]MCE3036557.1 hypothetical protein [Helicobacter anatolicus]